MYAMEKILVTPQQAKALDNYQNPLSDTFGNLTQSLIKAGYTKGTANTLCSKKNKWLSSNIERKVKMIYKAEEHLEKIQNLDVKLNSKLNVDIAKLQVDVNKFILKNLAKGKYNDNPEQVAPNIQVNITKYSDHVDKAPIDVEVENSTSDIVPLTE